MITGCPLDSIIGVPHEPPPVADRLGKTQGYGLRSPPRPEASRWARSRLPSALEHLDELARWQGDRTLALVLSYDGRLAHLIDPPGPCRAILRSLSERRPVVLVSALDRTELETRVDLPDPIYAGSHGLDLAGRWLRHTVVEADMAIAELNRVLGLLRRTVGTVDGVVLEPARFSLTIHHHEVTDPEIRQRVRRSVDWVLRDTAGLRKRALDGAIELQPALDWNRGRALRWITNVLELDPHQTLVIYTGDDDVDESAFAALSGMGSGMGLAVRVGPPVSRSHADFGLRDSEQLVAWLRWLLDRA